MIICNDKVTEKFLSAFLLFIAIFFVCILVFIYPICSDDYPYAFIHGTSNRVCSLGDIFVSQYHHYFHIHGRIWPEALTQLFMIYDKALFNFSLIICYVSSALLIANLARIRIRIALGLIIPSLWILVPVPGQTIFWLCGACNYIFATFLSLGFLTLLLKGKRAGLWVALPLAVIVGNSHEGSSVGLLVALLLFSVLDRNNKRSTLFYANLLMLLFGIMAIFLSPGTTERMAHAAGNATSDSFMLKHLLTLAKGVLHFFRAIVHTPLEYLLIIILLIGCIVSNAIYKKKKNEIHILGFSLAVGAFVNFILPLAANVSYPRAFYGASSMALISSYIAILPVLVEKKKLLVFLYITLLIANVVTFIVGSNQISRMKCQETYILQALAQGEGVICLPERLANIQGRFIEEYGNFNNYRMNGSKAAYIGAPQEYSILSNKEEIEVFKQCDFNELQKIRVHYTTHPNAIIIRLKKRHQEEAITFIPKQENTFINRLKSRFVNKKQKRAIPFAAIAYKGEYYIIIPSPVKDITLEVTYKDGEQETMRLNSTE